jgi:hypothetical protein
LWGEKGAKILLLACCYQEDDALKQTQDHLLEPPGHLQSGINQPLGRRSLNGPSLLHRTCFKYAMIALRSLALYSEPGWRRWV